MNTPAARRKVVVLGGGVAGMSAAHELAARGFRVEVFERKPIAGGKARSISVEQSALGGPASRAPLPSTGADGRRRWLGLPGEHGFRFFPGFYRHIVDTMAGIPYGRGSVAQNLVDTTEVQIARFDRAPILLPTRFPRSIGDLKLDLSAVISLLGGSVQIPLDEVVVFIDKMWRILTSCEERRFVEYERINWWDFIEAEGKSAGYQTCFGNGITRSLVAAKARRASTKTIGDIFLQIVLNILQPGVSADRLLNGPTNDVWMNPWLEHLLNQGVTYHLNAEVRAIHCERGRVAAATIAMDGRLHRVTADYFIAALPVERMADLLDPALLAGDASLANLRDLTEYVEWMNGIQFYLTEDIGIAHGHTTYVDTPWALTSVSQPQFWPAHDLSNFGDGRVRGLVSVDISDWDVPGMNGKEARHCSRQEIALECWAQLKRSLNVAGEEALLDEQLHSWFLDPDIADGDPATPGLELNAEPLLVNYVDTWRLRPEAVTRIPNFFLASDYVRTHTDLATMEAANEAARRAVNGVIRASSVDVDLCELWNLHEPEVFLPLRAYDRIRFREGRPWDANLMDLARAVLGLAEGASFGRGTSERMLGRSSDAEAAVAAAARDSSDGNLRQLRVTR